MSLLRLRWANAAQYDSSRQPWNIPHAMCRMAVAIHLSRWTQPLTFQAHPYSAGNIHTKLGLFNPLSFSSCQPVPLVTCFSLQSNLGWWLCSRFSMWSRISEITRATAGVWGHEKTLPRDSWENQKPDVSTALPCWQSAMRLVRYLWVKKKGVSG